MKTAAHTQLIQSSVLAMVLKDGVAGALRGGNSVSGALRAGFIPASRRHANNFRVNGFNWKNRYNIRGFRPQVA